MWPSECPGRVVGCTLSCVKYGPDIFEHVTTLLACGSCSALQTVPWKVCSRYSRVDFSQLILLLTRLWCYSERLRWNSPLRGGIVFANNEVVHRSRFKSPLHFATWKISTQERKQEMPRFLFSFLGGYERRKERGKFLTRYLMAQETVLVLFPPTYDGGPVVG